MATKQYAFYYHFFKKKGKMSIHFQGTCHIVDNVVCKVPCQTKWNKRQPILVMKGKASSVRIIDNIGYIE